MTYDERDGERETERDVELQRLLARWSSPAVPDGLDARVLAAYRRETGNGQAWWKRLVAARVHVPLPVAVAVLLLLIVTATLARRPAPTPVTATPTAGTAAPAEPVQAVRNGEAPVVTRTSLAGFQPVSEVTAVVVTEVPTKAGP